MGPSLLAGIAMTLAFAGDDAKQGPKEPLVIRAHEDTVRSVAFSPDGRVLATVGYDSSVRLWDMPSGRERATLKGHVGNLLSVAYSPDGKTLASGAVDGVRLWDAATGREKLKLEGLNVLVVAFSPDGKRLAVGGQNGGNLLLYGLPDGDHVPPLAGEPGDDVVFSVAYSPDGKLLASARQDMDTSYGPDGKKVEQGNGTTITLWRVEEGGQAAVARQFEKLIGSVWAVTFSPDGKTLAAATENKEVRLWDVATGKERPPLRGHTDVVHGLAYSPDGSKLASASMDKTVKVWDANSGEELATLAGHGNAVKCVAFSPDGRSVASGSWDNTARVWDVSGVKAGGQRRPK